MAADKTFGVKVTDEVLERVNAMIGASGESSKKEWFEKLFSSWIYNQTRGNRLQSGFK
jgi:hypothetical protein